MSFNCGTIAYTVQMQYIICTQYCDYCCDYFPIIFHIFLYMFIFAVCPYYYAISTSIRSLWLEIRDKIFLYTLCGNIIRIRLCLYMFIVSSRIQYQALKLIKTIHILRLYSLTFCMCSGHLYCVMNFGMKIIF